MKKSTLKELVLGGGHTGFVGLNIGAFPVKKLIHRSSVGFRLRYVSTTKNKKLRRCGEPRVEILRVISIEPD